MARRHWLDPLARRLLIASGQIPPAAGSRQAGLRTTRSDPQTASLPVPGEAGHQEAVERELLALRLAQNPAAPLRHADDVRRAADLGWYLDVNRATATDWRRLPGCSGEQVDLLLRLQRGGVQLSSPEDLAAVLELDAATLASWLPLLRFCWYGEPAPVHPGPVAVNQASARELAALPDLSPERSARLLRERSRAPFRDLADLRDRLALPPAVAEQWIGRVSFAPGRAGPDLPLGAPAPANGGSGLSAAAEPPQAGPSAHPGAPPPGPAPSASPRSDPAAKGEAGPSLPPAIRRPDRRTP